MVKLHNARQGIQVDGQYEWKHEYQLVQPESHLLEDPSGEAMSVFAGIGDRNRVEHNLNMANKTQTWGNLLYIFGLQIAENLRNSKTTNVEFLRVQVASR